MGVAKANLFQTNILLMLVLMSRCELVVSLRCVDDGPARKTKCSIDLDFETLC